MLALLGTIMPLHVFRGWGAFEEKAFLFFKVTDDALIQGLIHMESAFDVAVSIDEHSSLKTER